MSSDLFTSLTAPNGRKYEQPIGLYINGEFVKSSNGQKLESINPTYVLSSLPSCSSLDPQANSMSAVTRNLSSPSTQPPSKTSTPP